MTAHSNPTPEFWADAWTRHLETYLDATPRTGIWLEHVFAPQKPKTLEIAGGSCRDSRHLFQRGWDASGSDFDSRTIAYLDKRFNQLGQPLLQLDAFSTNVADKSFSVTFHNGFYVLFNNDADVVALLREQARITRDVMVVIVHNALNLRLRDQFARLGSNDPVYRIRFFAPDQIVSIIRASGVPCSSIKVRKFGGRADALYRDEIKGLPNLLRKAAPALVPRLYACQSWANTERVAVIIRL